jgi:suppressor of G2 allele of SKP1
MEGIMARAMAENAQSEQGKGQTISLNRDAPVQKSAKDAASLGAEALAAKDFTLAITHYTKGLQQHPQAVDYYIKRSTAYTRVTPPQYAESLADAEKAVAIAHKRAKRESIAQAQLRRGIALYSLNRYGGAIQCFDWVKKVDPENKSLKIWVIKTKSKMEASELEVPPINVDKVGQEVNALAKKEAADTDSKTGTNGNNKSTSAPPPVGVRTPPSQIRHDWYQSNDTVTVTVLAKGVPKDKATVEINPQSLAVSFPLPTGSDFDFSLDPLYAPIKHEESSYRILSTKVEFILKKATPGQKWHALENPNPQASTSNPSTTATDEAVRAAVLAPPTASAPVYPTSSKKGPKNWDKLAADLTKKPKAGESSADSEDWNDDDEDGGDPANAFFKKIFKGADPDTKRAMMKSYQESNGTALSTNWAEVSKGKVETSPPDGMEARTWGD